MKNFIIGLLTTLSIISISLNWLLIYIISHATTQQLIIIKGYMDMIFQAGTISIPSVSAERYWNLERKSKISGGFWLTRLDNQQCGRNRKDIDLHTTHSKYKNTLYTHTYIIPYYRPYTIQIFNKKYPTFGGLPTGAARPPLEGVIAQA